MRAFRHGRYDPLFHSSNLQAQGADRRGHGSRARSVRSLLSLIFLAAFVSACNPDPPPAVPSLTCRAKPTKVDLTWPSAPRAVTYEVFRAEGGLPPTKIATSSGTVHADFGLTNGVTYTYTVVARNSAGSSAPSPTCNGTPNTLGGTTPDQPPLITSTPVVEAFENTVWYYDITAVDPEGLQVTIDAPQMPFGMNFDPATARLSWSPQKSQVGPHTLQVRATDPAGNSAIQPFDIQVKVFNDPPVITSTPSRFVEVGQIYNYPATAFEPEGETVGWVLAAGAPPGMTIGASSGAVQWTPTAADVGEKTLTVEARDPGGNLDTQTYALEVLDLNVQLLSPSGVHMVAAGSTLTLPVTANHPKAVLGASPIPSQGNLQNGTFTFTPTRDQEGRFDVQFEARLAGKRDAELVTINVTVPNAPPQITAIPLQTVDEGKALSFVVTATDPDGDPVKIRAPGLGLTNAIFNEMGARFDFMPAFDQQGSYSVTFEADDGKATSQGVAQIDVIDVAPPATSLSLVVDPPQSPTFSRSAPITGSVVGQAGPPAAPVPLIFITGVAPTEVRQGRTATVTLGGLNTQFADGQTGVQFGSGISVDSLRVLSPTQIEADITVAVDAAIGQRQILASDGGSQIPSVVAFAVTEGAASVSGQILDPFTNQPVAGATVIVPGTTLKTTTAADGTFTLDGIPGGATQVTVTAPNFEILNVDVTVGANAIVNLDVPIGLKALARPFNPGGSLPRATILASILDRGVSGNVGGLDVEQAKALIEDTIIVVGGNEAGVIDENGVQLNPNVVGGGRMSLTPEGLNAQAEALIQGHVHTLGDLTNMMLDLFHWPSGRPIAEDFISYFQVAVNEAWADPSDPTNAMAIVLFNTSPTSLSASPPLLTAETPLNRFQAFLMLTSYLIETTEVLEASIDQRLLSNGIDPDQITQVPDPTDASRFATALASGLGWVFASPAYAQGTTVLPPNAFRNNGGTNGRTFRKIFKQTHEAAKLEAAFAVAIPIAAATAAAAATAIMTGGTLAGAVGVVGAIGVVTAVMDGFLAILWQKYILGSFLAATLQELSPVPPLPTDSRIEGDKFILEFDQSATQTVNNRAANGASTGVNGLGLDPTLLQYTYGLFRFPDMQSTNENAAVPMGIAPQDLGNGKQRFVIPAAKLRPGANYFRIATIQTVKKVDQRPLNGNLQIPLRPQSQAPVSQPGPVDAAKETLTKIPWTLDINQQLAALTDADNFFNSNFKPQVDGVRVNVQNARIEKAANISAIRQARFEKITQRTVNERNLLLTIETEVFDTSALKEFSKTGEVSPFGFNGTDSPGSRAIQRTLGTNTPPSAATLAEVQAMTQSHQTIRVESQAMGDYLDTQRSLKSFSTDLKSLKISDPTGSTTRTIMVMDPVTKVATPTPFTFQHSNQGEALAKAAAFAEGGKAVQAQNAIDGARVNLDQTVDARLTRKVGGPYGQWKNEAMTKITQVHNYESGLSKLFEETENLKFNQIQRQANAPINQALTDRLDARIAQGNQAPTNAQNLKRGVNAGFTTLGIASAVLDPASAFLQGVAVLESNFSPVHIYTHNPNQIFSKPPVLADPDLSRFGGVITAKVDPNNPKGGQIISAYPEYKYNPDFNSTGFPPLYLATDSQGRIFSINGRSTDQFGGRLFRFDGLNNMARGFAGSVKYYSTLIGYGRPAAPIAMAVGEYYEATEPGPLEDLFIANTDFIENPPRNEILRVQTHRLERPPYSNGLGVDHIVGQTYLTHPDFQFSGPSDMKVMPPPPGTTIQRTFFSDEDTLWVFQQDLAAPELPPVPIKLLVEAGRRWSGIAIDVRNNVYVADFSSGDLAVLSFGDILQLENAGGATCVHIAPGLMKEPEYIALDHDQKKLVVSDRDGVHTSITLPVFVQGLAATKAFLVTLGKQFAVPFVSRQNCPDYRIVFPEGVHVEQRAFRLRVEGSATTNTTTKEIDVALPGFGGSDVLDLDAALQDFVGYFN